MIVAGPNFGVFCLGFFVPICDDVSALVGLLVGFAVNVWLYIGRIFADTPTDIVIQNAPFPTTTEGCSFPNGTQYPQSEIIPESDYVERTGLLAFYNVAYFYIGCIGFNVTFISGFLLSIIQFGRRNWTLTEQQKDPKLHYFIFDHFLFKWMPSKWRTFLRWGLVNPQVSNTEEKINNEDIDEKKLYIETEPTSL